MKTPNQRLIMKSSVISGIDVSDMLDLYVKIAWIRKNTFSNNFGEQFLGMGPQSV